MSQSVKYKSISLKVNMKKSVVKKEDIQALIAKKSDLIRRKVVTLARNFDKLEKVLRMSTRAPSSTHGYSMSSEYNLILSTQKHFCSQMLKVIDVLDSYDKKYNEHLTRNDVDTREISQGVEDLVDKLENGIIHLPPPGVPIPLDSPINFVSPVFK